MVKSVMEAYPELWHYTSAAGLHGILSSQQLWATNIFYLNDAEEFTGFFNRKLEALLTEGLREGVADALKTPEGRQRLTPIGTPENILKIIPKELAASLRDVSIRFPAYVTSFCFTEPGSDAQDGLLSQWRGYGPDGGYAVVFDTNGLNDLLMDEQANFIFSMGLWGDVDYYGLEGRETHAETAQWEAEVQRLAKAMLLSPSPQNQEALFNPIMSLAIRHKHRGFKEEREVRIAVVPANDELVAMHQSDAEVRKKKPINFFSRQGVLTPYVALFGSSLDKKSKKLPIKRVIVGPHHDKEKRRKAVEILLNQLQINAEVVTTDIPFIGR